MRAFILAGTTAIVLTLGASSVYANGPLSSPYEVWYPSQIDPTPTPAPEGRASYIDNQNGAVQPQRHHTHRHHPAPAVDVVQ
jgi:hypothetical protein